MPEKRIQHQLAKKDVVNGIMAFQGKDVEEDSEVCYLKYRCPKPSCPNALVCFREKSGFTNPYAHLRCCYASGKSERLQNEVMSRLYEEARNTALQTGGSIRAHFRTESILAYAKAV